MLKRTDIRKLAESAGLMAPSLADAEAAAEQRRTALAAAHGALEAARVSLDAAHDAGAPAAEISRLEAVLASAGIDAGRSQLAFAASERRLNAAREAEASKTREAAKAARDKALATLDRAAAELDRLAKTMATHAAAIDALYPTLNECRRDGVAGPFVPTSGAAMAEFSLLQAVASQNGEYTGNRPSASEAAARVTGAVLAVAA